MMKYLNHSFLSLCLLSTTSILVSAFPNHLARRTLETNCGPIACITFNAKEQFVDVTPGSPHQYVAPGKNDLRGPCPGLNAAANHGFLPHNGIVSLQQTIDGMTKAFGMGTDFSTSLACIAILFSGDVGSLTWSIGGPYIGSLISALGGEPEGISYSHNKYESDASATRPDAYINGGDASSLDMSKFKHLYNMGDTYTMETIRSQNSYNRNLSESTNPYYFSGPFSGILAAPAAHHFIINFMSNHSADQPSGYLDKANLKTFYGISGPDDALVWNAGQEQIPQNWYRRPSSNPYDLKSALADIAINAAEYPGTIQIGGNTGTVNSYVGVDLANLTGGTYNADTLLEGNNLGCFAFQAASNAFLNTISNGVGLAGEVFLDAKKLIDTYLTPILSKLECPTLASYNSNAFSQFPGASYNPVA